MIAFDFYVTKHHLSDHLYEVTTTKQVVEGNTNDTLSGYLELCGVDDAAIGHAIEKLEALPNGKAQVSVHGRRATIVINQSW